MRACVCTCAVKRKFALTVLVLCFVMGYVLQSGEIASTWKSILSLLSNEDCLSWQEGGDSREGTKKDALGDLLWRGASRASFFFIVNLTITGIVSKATLGKLLRDRVERIITGFTGYHLEVNWTELTRRLQHTLCITQSVKRTCFKIWLVWT